MMFTLWLEFEEWEQKPDDNPYKDYCNIQIEMSCGKRYALNVWTIQYLESELDELKNRPSPSYLIGPDLIVEKLERTCIENCITQLLEKEELKEEWLINIT